MILTGATLSSALSQVALNPSSRVGIIIATQRIGDNKEVDRENTHLDDYDGLSIHRLLL